MGSSPISDAALPLDLPGLRLETPAVFSSFINTAPPAPNPCELGTVLILPLSSMTTPEVPRLMVRPLTVSTGPPIVRTVGPTNAGPPIVRTAEPMVRPRGLGVRTEFPSAKIAVGMGENAWSGFVEEPTTKLLWPREMGRPLMVIGGEPGVRVWVPTIISVPDEWNMTGFVPMAVIGEFGCSGG